MFEGYNHVEKNGAPARLRFSDPAAVSAVYQKLSEDDIKDASRRLMIRKLYEGNLPYRKADLEAAGLKNVANVNFLGLQGLIDSRADMIVRLQSDKANLVELRPVARELAGPEAARVGEVVAEEFSAMLRSNGKFISALAMMHREADLYGLGPVTWRSGLDYNPVALERGQVKFMEDASVVSSDNELYMFESTISAAYLQSLRDMPDIAAAEGWRMDRVDYWMKAVYKDGADTRHETASATGASPAESVQSLVRRNILGEDRQFDTFHVLHVFVRETAWPRGVTHIIVPSSEAKDKNFLYYRQNAYRTMDECFLWFPYSVKERYAREVRGLASRVYAIEKLRNRFLCQVVDSAFRAASLVLNTQNGAPSAQQISISEQGPYTILPPGVTPAPAQISPNFQQLAQVTQVLDKVAVDVVMGTDRQPIATSGSKLFAGAADRVTKAEQEIQQAIRTHRTEADFTQCKDVVDKICRQTFMRALKLALMPDFMRVDYPEISDFIARCTMRGVGLDQLATIPQYFTICACNDLSLGADGKVAEIDMFHQMYAGDIDEAGRRVLARKRAILRFGLKDADQIVPEVSRDQSPSDQASFATMENNQMKMGFQVMVGSDQWHWSHIPVHSQLLQEIVDMVKAPEDNSPDLNEFNGDPNQTQQIAEQTLQNLQDDPKKILGILTMCSQHVQGHLQIGGAQQNMKSQAQQVAKMLRDLRPTIKALNLAVATQERVEQAQREKREREMRELQEQADQNVLRKAQIEADKKAETDRYRIDREHEVAMHKAELEASRAAGAEGRESVRFSNDEARKDAESVARIDREEKLTRARVNAANAVGRMNAVQDATGFGMVQPGEIANIGPSIGMSL